MFIFSILLVLMPFAGPGGVGVAGDVCARVQACLEVFSHRSFTAEDAEGQTEAGKPGDAGGRTSFAYPALPAQPALLAPSVSSVFSPVETSLAFDPAQDAGQQSASGPQTGAPPPKSAAGATARAEAPGAEPYSYQPAGRRDPFVSLLGTGVEVRRLVKRSDGPAGLTVGEIAVRGIITSKGTLLAMIQAPDKRTYLVHGGDKLMDGTIKAVTAQGLLIIQDVHEPLSSVKQREIRKFLRSAEESKP